MTLEDQIVTLQAEVAAIKTAIAAIPTTPAVATVDLTAVNAKLDEILAQFAATPVVPAPAA